MKRKIIPGLAVIVVGIIIFFLNIHPIISITIPGISESTCLNQENDGLGLGCACTQKATHPIGFPFKANLYDYCKQDDTAISWIIGLNIAIGAVILGSTYWVLKSKLTTQ